ncbi:hypothetical protein ABZU93_33665, partial [Micromonospora zamorensis]
PDPTLAAPPGDRLVPSDGPAGAPVSAPTAEKAVAKKAVAKKAVAKKAIAKKAIAKKPPATISRTDDDTPTPAVMPAKKAARPQPPDAAE